MNPGPRGWAVAAAVASLLLAAALVADVRTGLVAMALLLLALALVAWALWGRAGAPPPHFLHADTATGAPRGDAAAPADPATGPAWREVYATQAEQVARLQREAQLDEVTGLPRRSHFLAQLQHRLDEPGGTGLGLLIVRVLELEATNLRLGHEATDRLLATVADVLMTYVDRVPSTLAGRLNGTDFALCLPVAGVAAETAASLRTTLAAIPALRAGHAEVAVAGVDSLRDTPPGAALAAADAALARAEADASNDGVVMQAPDRADMLGAGAWRERIRAALLEGRTQLVSSPVCNARGQVLHLECALRLQCLPGGAFDAAGIWRAAARRGRLLPQVDLAALERAVDATAGDGQARAVQISASSLSAPGFMTDVAAALTAAPGAARRISVDLVDDLRAGAAFAPWAATLAAALAVWAPWGLRVGVCFSPAVAAALPELKAAGVCCVKLEATQVQGLAADSAVHGYVAGAVSLVHDLGLGLVVTGVSDAADAAALWALGVDAASGPALPAAQPVGPGV